MALCTGPPDCCDMKRQVIHQRSFYLQLLLMVPTIALLGFRCWFAGMGTDQLVRD
jgi:hypothetical protein